MNGRDVGKRLVRRREGRVVAGVCAGLGEYFGLDPTLVRVIFAALVVFGGSGILLYLLAWLVIPEEDEPQSIAENMLSKTRNT